MGYRLRYSRLDGRSRTLTNTIHDRMEREFTIEDLEEWTEYRVQVQAFNAIGPGPWSQTVVGRTRESGTLSTLALSLGLKAVWHPFSQPACPPTCLALCKWSSGPRVVFYRAPSEELVTPPCSSLCVHSAFIWTHQYLSPGYYIYLRAGAME